MRYVFPILALLASVASLPTHAEIPNDKIKIGILQDLPDPYATETGDGGFVAAQIAGGDFSKLYLHGDAEILAGESTGGLDKDLEQVRDWLDKEHVAAVVSSASALVNQRIGALLAQHHRTLLVAEAVGGSAEKLCSPSTIIWGVGETARTRALAQVFAKQKKNQWYVVSPQSPAGVASQNALQQAVATTHGQIVGQSQHTAGTLDFGHIVEAIDKTNANADVTLLSEADSDLINVLRTLTLDRPTHPMSFAAPYAQITDIDQAGPAVADGLVVVAPFYWERDEKTRDFASRWAEQMHGRPVTENAAAVYAATSSFLYAAKSADDLDAAKVGAELRRAPIRDSLFGPATIRADGQVIFGLDVYRVKPPNQIDQRWAYFSKLATVPGEQAFPANECPGTMPQTGDPKRP